jgi:hypothetical protein
VSIWDCPEVTIVWSGFGDWLKSSYLISPDYDVLVVVCFPLPEDELVFSTAQRASVDK